MRKEDAMPDFIKNEEEMLKFWQDNNCFDKLVKKNENSGKHFRFLDGPITANNGMGVHHAWNRSLKDIMLKYKAMNGYSAHYQNGFDAQGLWVEVETEKELGLKDKRDIEKLGLDKFTTACMDRVKKYSGIITEQSKRLGQWMDWEHSYFTNSDENITSIWYFLKECFNRGWLVQKYRPMPWCSHCGTSLSEHELADSYKDMEHLAVFFKLPIKNTNNDILVWTTTPWTLSANVAVAVNPELEYSVCKVKSQDRNIIVCSSAKKVLKDDIVEVVKELKGSELVGLEYETCFPELKEQNFAHKIVAWEDVDAEEGSGAVHIAPGCGAEDFELGQKLGLPNVIPVDESGIFFDDFGFLAGKNTTEVADLVFDELKKRGKLYYTHKHMHRYPICWRCKNPLIFRLTKEWYIKADEIRPKLLEAVETVRWQPEFIKKRMTDWLENMGDWCISRKRFYGLPLPFYICQKCGKITVVGSLDELKKLSSEEEVNKLPHLHRPYIDDIEITCPHCGEKVKRVTEVGDCWLDAGITPFSTKKYFTDRKFWEQNFPAECVIEMKEQIRLWFYSLLFMSVTLTGRAPYEKVIGFASLVAEDGSKFSKSGKNNISFFDACNKIGADVIRYMFASNNMLNDTRFGYGITDDIRRKLLGLWNAYIFFNTYAVLDNPKLDGFTPNITNVTDKWLVEVTNKFIANSKKYYDDQQFFLVVRDFEKYVDDLTNWYIRVNRRRFWKSDDEEDKRTAYWCLYTAIKKTCQVMAPIIPFMTEHIWQNMCRSLEPNSSESIILSDFPSDMLEMKDENLEEKTDIARNIIALAQRLRNENQLKIKQPLKEMFVCASVNVKPSVELFGEIIKEELNIKTLVFEENVERFNERFLTVNFKTAGAVLKGDVQKLKNALLKVSDADMAKLVREYDEGKVSVGEFKNLDSSLFLVSSKPKQEFVIMSDGGITVVLDITIDHELLVEGLYRELTRAAQVLRKEAGFKVEDRIIVSFKTSSQDLTEVLKLYRDKIMAEVLIKEVVDDVADCAIDKTLSVSGEEIQIKMKKA